MSGTDATKAPVTGGPAIILIDPQLGENIGTAARAMLNCGLTDLRLVRPRDGWPNPKARSAASGADLVLDNARLFDRTGDAVADLGLLYATTARPRDMVKPVVTPRQAAAELRAAVASGVAAGILFGPERAGLDNDDVVRADAILAVPLNPAFSSLNLAQAVLLIGYEWFQSGDATPPRALADRGQGPATQAELANFFTHLEQALDASGFLGQPERRPSMVRNLRNLFRRMAPTAQEVRTLHGVVTSLTGRHLDGRPRRSAGAPSED